MERLGGGDFFVGVGGERDRCRESLGGVAELLCRDGELRGEEGAEIDLPFPLLDLSSRLDFL